MTRFCNFLVIVSLFTLIACNEDLILDATLPETESKLVVNSTFSTFTYPYPKPVNVKLWYSLPILDTNKTEQITDADVLFFEDGKLIDTLYFDNEQDGYVIDHFYFPSPEKEYSITVIKDGFQPISASSGFPARVEMLECKVTSLAGINADGQAYSSVNIHFQDPPETENYYEVLVTVAGGIAYENQKTLWTTEEIITKEPYYPSILSFENKNPKRLLFNDKQINGKEKSLLIYFFSPQAGERGHYKVLFDFVDIYLRSVSKDYYGYYTSLLQHKYNQNGDFFYGISEPLNVSTNIKGGYGIFSGYQYDMVTCVIDSVTIY